MGTIVMTAHDEDVAAWSRRLHAPRHVATALSAAKRHRTSPVAQQRRLDAAQAREHDWQEQDGDQ